MAKFLDWKYLTEDQVLQLEATYEIVALKRLLESFFKVPQQNAKKNSILVDFHFYNYAFCKENAFNNRQTSTFMSLMKDLLSWDSAEANATATIASSFEHFKTLLTMHSVERPPVSICVFEQSLLPVIVDFVIDRYYSQHRLLRFIFGAKKRVVIRQVLHNEVEVPSPLFVHPLGDGLLLDPVPSSIVEPRTSPTPP